MDIREFKFSHFKIIFFYDYFTKLKTDVFIYLLIILYFISYSLDKIILLQNIYKVPIHMV